MSGGAFDYAYARVDAFADALAERLDDRDLGAFSDETHAALRRIQRLALIAAQLMKEAELLYSADTSDTTFLQRVAKLQRDHDDMMRIRTADSAYAHRLATMLECALLDRVGSWDEGHALLDEYRVACCATMQEPPTLMGEPVLAHNVQGNRPLPAVWRRPG